MFKELCLENKIAIVSFFGAVVCGLLTFLIYGNLEFSIFVLLSGVVFVGSFYYSVDQPIKDSSRSGIFLKKFFSFSFGLVGLFCFSIVSVLLFRLFL